MCTPIEIGSVAGELSSGNHWEKKGIGNKIYWDEKEEKTVAGTKEKHMVIIIYNIVDTYFCCSAINFCKIAQKVKWIRHTRRLNLLPLLRIPRQSIENENYLGKLHISQLFNSPRFMKVQWSQVQLGDDALAFVSG